MLFCLAHRGRTLHVKEEAYASDGEEYLVWDLPSSVELYERMTPKPSPSTLVTRIAKRCAEARESVGVYQEVELWEDFDPTQLDKHCLGPRLRAQAQ